MEGRRQLVSYADESTGEVLDVPFGDMEKSKQEGERMVWDADRGMMLDRVTNLFYNQADNLFYKYVYDQEGTETVKRYHWSTLDGRYMLVTNEERDFAVNEEIEGGKDENHSKKGNTFSFQPEHWQFDATSGKYYHKQTGLYYDLASNLYWDYDSFPAICYHFDPTTQKLFVVKEQEEEEEVKQIEEEEEEVVVPDRLFLVLEKTGDEDKEEETTADEGKEQIETTEDKDVQIFVIGKSEDTGETSDESKE
jgi:hypothetical protein